MDKTQRRWDAHWSRSREDDHDGSWLAPWLDALKTAPGPVLELGCGDGVDTVTLVGAGLDVIALDYSPAGLLRVGERTPSARRVLCDLRDGLPLREDRAGAIVASLCLHYFDAATTATILADLARVLAPRGVLLARVNSTRDIHYGASGGPELEPHFYDVRGETKRFFDENDVRRFFGALFTLEHVEEVTVGMEPEKHAWLVCAR